MRDCGAMYFIDEENMNRFLQTYVENNKLLSPVAEYGSVYQAGERHYVYTRDGLMMMRTGSEIVEDEMKREMMSMISYQVNKEYKTYDRFTDDEKELYGRYADELIKIVKNHTTKIEFGYKEVCYE